MAKWTAARRREALNRNHALPPVTDGDEPRYPIEDCQDFDNAVRDLNRPGTPDKERVRRYIARRGVELGCEMPENWRVTNGS